MSAVDLTPAAHQLATLVAAVPPDALSRPTPCTDTTLGDLIDHVGGFARVFAAAAEKDLGELTSQPPSPDGTRLEPDWNVRIPREVEALAEAWLDSDAWTGMTRAGGVDLPGEMAGIIALDEVVIHSWDLARASGQEFSPDRASLEAVLAFVEPMSDPAQAEAREGLFGPVVPVPADAPLLDRVLGLTGRDPGWSAG